MTISFRAEITSDSPAHLQTILHGAWKAAARAPHPSVPYVGVLEQSTQFPAHICRCSAGKMGSAKNTAIVHQHRMPLDDTTRRSYCNFPTHFKIINLSYCKSSKFKVGHQSEHTTAHNSLFIFYISFQKLFLSLLSLNTCALISAILSICHFCPSPLFYFCFPQSITTNTEQWIHLIMLLLHHELWVGLTSCTLITYKSST